MKASLNTSTLFYPILILCILFLAGAAESSAQAGLSGEPAVEKGLFDSDDVLQITLRGDMRNLLNDKSDDPKDYPLEFSYADSDGTEIIIPIEVKTRGHFRRLLGNCAYPPLLLQFPKKGAHLNTLFREQKDLKLVMPCSGEKYVIREWLVYELYNLVTPKSFRARLVSVKLEDTNRKKSKPSFYGILLEEEKQMARRNGMIAVEGKWNPQEVQTDAFLSMAVFEYLIGNTDWSIQYLQNIKLLAQDSSSTPIAVPYDFDHAGIVAAPYAQPAPELKMTSVQQRRYRGYCIRNLQQFEPVIARYNQLKEAIYRVYTDCAVLDAQSKASTLKYLDEFYKAINDPKTWQRDFAYPCDPNGTGNVVIRGLKEN